MRIALFGGTFDPIHVGHVRAAKAAAKLLRLDQVLFVPSASPPHKLHYRLTPYTHRFGMVTLACGGEREFIPSLLEAPSADGQPQYSVSTTQRLKRKLGLSDRLFFLIGADAILDLPHWKDYGRLLALADFIVVSRPGFSVDEIRKVLPSEPMPRMKSPRGVKAFRLRRTILHVIESTHVAVAARGIRKRVEAGLGIKGLVSPLVEDYIQKEGLYRLDRRGRIGA